MGVHVLGAVAAPLGPAISEVALGILTLGAVLVFIVCYGLHEGWDHTIGYGLRWIADQIHDVAIDVGFYTIRPFEFVADVFRSVDKHISHALAVAALNTEKAVVYMWHLTAEVFWWSVHETKALAIDVLHAYEYLQFQALPDAAKWAYREAVAVAHRYINRELAGVRADIRELDADARIAEATATTALHTAGHALDWSESHVGHISKEIDALKARVGTLAHALSRASIVAIIGATIFKDFGLGWLRCGNVGRMGRAICGMPLRALEDVLGLLADYLIVTNMCQVIPLLEEAYSEVAAPAVHLLTQAIDSSPCVKGNQSETLPVPRLHLPANPSLALSLP